MMGGKSAIVRLSDGHGGEMNVTSKVFSGVTAPGQVT
jgi:hypothetical protein